MSASTPEIFSRSVVLGSPAERAAIASDLLKHPGGSPVLNDDWSKRAVRFVGPTTVLPSSFEVTRAADALVGAFCSAVASYGEAIGGADEIADVVVHSIGSAVAFGSERHLRLPASSGLWDELSGHYETADGHVQFHTNFPHHRAGLLATVGCGPDAARADVARVVAEAGRFEIERSVSEAGGIAAALRTAQEWAEHPHAIHVADQPPLVVTPIGGRSTGAPTGSATADRPLAGLRVLDMTRVIAGPVCTRALSAYGADVLRIGAADLPVVESILADTTLGKRFAHCDITTPEGRTVVLSLAAEADVVVMGFRPGALAAHGLDRAAFLDANPNLILAELSAFGETGPWGGRPGFDSITQSATGVVAAETHALGAARPQPLPCQLLDHGTGFMLAIGVLSALLNRLDGAGGQLVTASLLTTRNWLWGLGAADPTAGQTPDAAQIEAFTENRDSAYGRIVHARPPGRIGRVPARWNAGPALPGADAPEWASV